MPRRKKDILFFDAPAAEMSKVGTDLGDDTNLWSQQIKATFEKDLNPIVRAGGKPFLNFTYKDFPKSVALGGITTTVGGRILMFPVIIKNNDLAPFDNYYDQKDKGWHFLTPERSDNLVSGGSPYKGLTTAIPTDDVINYNDRMGESISWRGPAERVVLSSLDMTGRMKAFAEAVASRPDLLYTMHPKVAYAVKVLADSALYQGGIEKQASLDIPLEDAPMAALIRKMGLNNYQVKLGSVGDASILTVNVPIEGVMKIAAFFEKNADKILEDIDTNSAQAISRRDAVAPEIPRVISSHTDIDPVQRKSHIGSMGTYIVVKDDGREDIGLVLPIQGWDGKDTGNYLFDGETGYTVSHAIFGRRASTDKVMPRSPLEQGSLGVYIKETEGLGFSTWPIRIEQIWQSPETSVQIHATDIRNMVKLNLVPTDAFKIPTKINPDIAPQLIEHDRINVYIPSDMKFSQLPEDGSIKLAAAMTGEELKKQGRLEVDHPGSIFDVTRKNNAFVIYERGKMASLKRTGATTELPTRTVGDIHEADFILKMAGVNITEQLGQMVVGERLSIYAPARDAEREALADVRKMAYLELKRRATDFSDIKMPDAEALIKMANAYCKLSIDTLNDLAQYCQFPDMVKKAEKNEEESINSLLNLNFLSEENVDYFVDRLGTLDEAEDVLVRLLVVSRISDIGISPDDVKDALRGLTKTKEKFAQVKRLRMAW